MKREDIEISKDGTIQCIMVIEDNPCVLKLTPTQNTDIDTVRRILDEKVPDKKYFYITRNEFYRFCRVINNIEVFRGLTIINPKKEEMNLVIHVNNDLKASLIPMDDDDLDEILYTKKKLGDGLTNKPYFIIYIEV